MKKLLLLLLCVVPLITLLIFTFLFQEDLKEALGLKDDKEISQTSEYYYEEAANYARQSKWGFAIHYYTKAIKINPDYYAAFSDRGLVYVFLVYVAQLSLGFLLPSLP